MSAPVLLDRSGPSPKLLVDGRPFLVLGLQWDCDSCASREEMNPLFDYAVALNANTAALPVYWSEIEPSEGRYDFELVDERIRQARDHNLRLVLLWFATWKNACSFYCPDYIRADHRTYPLALDLEGTESPSLCPLGEGTLARDRGALRALFEHLRAVDTDRRVIMFQVENEPGVITTARCHCPR